MDKQNLDLKSLLQVANKVRIDIIESVYAAGSGHIGGALGITDILTYLYFQHLHISPQTVDAEHRDRFVLSPAHMVPALYATLAERGYFPISELKTLRQFGSRLQGHTFRNPDIGVETTGGSLAQGLSIACGMAMAAKLDGVPFRVYCLISDGELNEGQTWEAIMFAVKYKLDNLCIILDRNHIQQSNSTEEIMPLEPLRVKLEAFNLKVMEVDAHDFVQLEYTFAKANLVVNKPTLILANSVAGKGVGFMENNYEWHAKSITESEYTLALQELSSE